MERLASQSEALWTVTGKSPRRPRLAFVSPLPPERSGISDYSAELLPELARHYDIEVVVAQDEVTTPWIKANCPIRTVNWFRLHADGFDRVLYHFGNSPFHLHMFSLLESVPGVVVLHDFFLSDIIAYKELHGAIPDCWTKALYAGHGYAAVQQRFHTANLGDLTSAYPCNLAVLRNAQGVIVHSANSLRLAQYWYGEKLSGEWAVIPHLRVPAAIAQNRKEARTALGLDEADFMVCSFGLLGPIKLNHRLLDAWLASPLATNSHCVLVFVGENEGGEYGQQIRQTIANSGFARRIRITGWADAKVFRQYLAAADVGVQLRTQTRGETSGTVLDCMNHGLATVVNAHGSMVDLPDDGVWKLPDKFTDAQLTAALATLYQDADHRRKLGGRARHIVQSQNAPRACADQYFAAIEGYHRAAATTVPALTRSIARIESAPTESSSWLALAEAIDRSITPPLTQRQLFVDVSIIAQRDYKTGIQRVVRGILLEWIKRPPDGYRVEPVYATAEQPGFYRYARQFTLKFLDSQPGSLADEPISYRAGDIFVGLDFYAQLVMLQNSFYQAMRRQGVSIHFVVYDMLLLHLPHCFPEDPSLRFEEWLGVVAQCDGAACISKAVADELATWLEAHGPKRERPFKLTWFHLGANIDRSAPTTGLPENATSVIASLRTQPSFLMVGTVEPRKGYAQTLAAFEALWAQGENVNLTIVGRQGWIVESLVGKLRAHPELGHRLFWLEGISDEFLEQIYAASTCLIAASEGEGFGLPLIEAAQHKLPIIARDIPVFREVAGEYAAYFSGKAPDDLAQAIIAWLQLFASGQHKTSAGMPWLTWEESAKLLLEAITKPAVLAQPPVDA